MCQILEEFWYGNICPDTDCCKGTKAEKELQEYIVTHYEDLHATLTEEQKEMLEKYDDCSTELAGIREREIFVYAFRLGARIAIETMQF